MTTHFFGDTAVLLGRSLRHIMRSPDTIITTTVMPIAFLLLFVYVFGGAIDSGSDSYVNYLLPGILLITIASGIVLHRVPALPGHEERHLRALPVHAHRPLFRPLGARGDLAGRQPDLDRRRRARRPRSWASARGRECWRGWRSPAS